MSQPLDLECHNLVKTFDDFTAVDNVSLEVPQGSFFLNPWSQRMR